jgi:glutamate carboxypeptidase
VNGDTDRLADLRGRRAAMVDLLADLVGIESPSADQGALLTCVEALARAGGALLGRPPVAVAQDPPALLWPAEGSSPVLVLCHLDTVWPAGTLARWPFAVGADGRATGPGAFDMKAGIVQALYAIASCARPHQVALLVTSDEELGSPASRALIEAHARPARAALVFEAAAGTSVKVARKGASRYDICVTGRAAHAGLEPERGANALEGLAEIVLALRAIARPDLGTTVVPTLAEAGTTSNTVPALARLAIDSRAASEREQQRVDAELRSVSTSVPGTRVVVEGGINRPPLPRSASEALYATLRDCARGLGLEVPGAAEVGGASDGNFTAAIGVPTLDGLGALGGNAHAEGEWVDTTVMADRAALAAELLDALTTP